VLYLVLLSVVPGVQDGVGLVWLGQSILAVVYLVKHLHRLLDDELGDGEHVLLVGVNLDGMGLDEWSIEIDIY
jgi:hypothetical protein